MICKGKFVQENEFKPCYLRSYKGYNFASFLVSIVKPALFSDVARQETRLCDAFHLAPIQMDILRTDFAASHCWSPLKFSVLDSKCALMIFVSLASLEARVIKLF